MRQHTHTKTHNVDVLPRRSIIIITGSGVRSVWFHTEFDDDVVESIIDFVDYL